MNPPKSHVHSTVFEPFTFQYHCPVSVSEPASGRVGHLLRYFGSGNTLTQMTGSDL